MYISRNFTDVCENVKIRWELKNNCKNMWNFCGECGGSLWPLRTGLNYSFGTKKYWQKIRNFDGFFRIFPHFSAFLNEFGHFCTDPWNSDKISSKFRGEIAIFMSNLRKFEWIEFWIDSFLPKLWRLFCWNFEIWAVQKYVNLVDLVKRFPTNIYLQKSASIQQRTSLSKFEENE